jgi:23S rRNA G2069 N7-methylase RlmK/C1962 C5-methylase RlmI
MEQQAHQFRMKRASAGTSSQPKWNIIVLLFVPRSILLAARLKKRIKHLRKWAKRMKLSCYRLYEKDIPEFPCIIDWYDGEVVIWLYRRKKDESQAQQQAFDDLVISEVQLGLAIKDDQISVKRRYRQSDHDGKRQQYQKIDQSDASKIVQENGLKFKVNLRDFLDTGLFLDHRNARSWVRELSSGLKVLNLFAYTGSFSVYATAGGARSVTSVDLSKTYSQWTEENLNLNHSDTICDQRIISADVIAWLKQAHLEKDHYDLIVCDPPTFSNSKKMKEASFVVDRDHPWLLADIAKILKPEGRCFFSTNSRQFKLDEQKLSTAFDNIEEVSQLSVPEDFRNKRIHQSWWLHKK